jgi:hypothetical protein
MNDKKQIALFGVGGVILLTVLLVLALTMFAVLTLSSAQADMRLSAKNARAVSDYYAADSKAVRLQALATAMWPADQPRPDAMDVLSALGTEYDLGVSEQNRGLMFFCDIPINEAGQILQLALFLSPPESIRRWQVKQWQFVPPATEIWDEPTLPVWIGD